MARSYHTHKSFMAIAEEEKLRAKGFTKIKEGWKHYVSRVFFKVGFR